MRFPKVTRELVILCMLAVVSVLWWETTFPYTATTRADGPGCTDPSAYNYNPSATEDDGSCILSTETPTPTDTPSPTETVSGGCMDPLAQNYNSNATWDNGSCFGCVNNSYLEYYTDPNGARCSVPVVLGCMNSNYFEYDSNANYDPGNLCFTLKIYGCRDSNASNYDSNANIDAECTYASPSPSDTSSPSPTPSETTIVGCMDPGANNYNPNANASGACDYTPAPVSGCMDSGALNYNPSANTPDTCLYDTAAPVIASPMPSPTVETTSATFTWTTDEDSSTKVEYGPGLSLGSDTTEQDVSPRVTSHSVTVSGLRACTTYFYRVVSTDARNNTVYGEPLSLTTAGCVSSSVAEASSVTNLDTAGGTVMLQGGVESTATLLVPASFGADSAAFQIHSLANDDVLPAISGPAGYTAIGDYSYQLTAMTGVATALSSFAAPVRVTMTYAAADVIGIDVSTLRIYRWNGSAWNALSNCTVNSVARSVTCQTSAFSVFTLFGQPPAAAAAPAPTAGTGSSGGYVAQVTPTASPTTSPVPAITPVPPATPTPVVTSTPRFARTLKLGSEGDDVLLLQRFLNYLGFRVSLEGAGSPGSETSYFGAFTESAVKRFQENFARDILAPYGLTSGTGIVGERTRSLLNHFLSSSAAFLR